MGPKAVAIAILPTIIAVVIAALLDTSSDFQMVILETSAAYSSFSFVIGFLLVFRTTTAYSRFWEGTTLVQVLRGVWVGAFGSIIAFTTTSKRPHEEVMEFRLKLVRLMSCLHANALDFIAPPGDRVQKVLGIAGLDHDTLKLMSVCEDETLLYVLVQWIQQMILHNIETGVIPTPPPIVSRVFQDLSTGIVTLNNVRKISETPFPFPYAQALSTVIVMHAAITPFVFAVWTENMYWAALFTFTAVFLFSCINFIAAEIEQPFGSDENDIDLKELQSKFNNILVTMLSPQCTQRPRLKKHRPGISYNVTDELRDLIASAESIEEAWERVAGNLEIEGGGAAETRQSGAVNIGRGSGSRLSPLTRVSNAKKSLRPVSSFLLTAPTASVSRRSQVEQIANAFAPEPCIDANSAAHAPDIEPKQIANAFAPEPRVDANSAANAPDVEPNADVLVATLAEEVDANGAANSFDTELDIEVDHEAIFLDVKCPNTRMMSRMYPCARQAVGQRPYSRENGCEGEAVAHPRHGAAQNAQAHDLMRDG